MVRMIHEIPFQWCSCHWAAHPTQQEQEGNHWAGGHPRNEHFTSAYLPIYTQGNNPMCASFGRRDGARNSCPTILNLHSLFFNGSHFHDLTSISTPTRGYDETGDEGNCISGWESLGKKKPLKLLSLQKIPSGTLVGPSLWMCDTCLSVKSSLWSTYFLLPHVFIFFSPFKYFLPLAVCDWTPWSLNSLGMSPLL